MCQFWPSEEGRISTPGLERASTQQYFPKSKEIAGIPSANHNLCKVDVSPEGNLDTTRRAFSAYYFTNPLPYGHEDIGLFMFPTDNSKVQTEVTIDVFLYPQV